MRPIFAIFNFLRGLKTTKFHEVPAGTAIKMYGEDSNGNLVQDDVPSGGGGASAFTELSDVPESYTDQAGKMLIVNEDENGLEYTDSHTHANKTLLDSITDEGDGNEFLADDGTYKAAGLTYFEESRSVAAPNATVPAHNIIPKGEETNIDVVISPKGTGAILAQVPDGTATGGNKRGTNAVDLQTWRTVNSRVASGICSAVISGKSNSAVSTCDAVISGEGNTINCGSGVICGGHENTIDTAQTTNCIVGGNTNTSKGSQGATFIGGGYNNYIGANSRSDSACHYAFIGGGANNKIYPKSGLWLYNNVICGGMWNEAGRESYNAILGGLYGKAQFFAQQAHAAGRFVAVGDAQRSNYVLRGNVLTTNYYRLYLDNASALIDLSQAGAYSTWQCKLMVSGLRRLTGAIDHYVSEHNFMIYRENGTPVIADFTEIHVHQVGASSVATGVSITTNSLAIDIATTDNNWQFVAHLETVETYSDSLV